MVANTVPENVACVQCSYALRGLENGGVCPECGWEIAKSMDSRLVFWASARFKRWFPLGFFIVAGVFALGASLSVGSLLVSRVTDPTTMGAYMQIVMVLRWGLAFAQIVGLIFATTAASPARDVTRRWRLCALWTAIVAVVIQFVPIWPLLGFPYGWILFPVVDGVWIFCLFAHARVLAKHIPSLALARSARVGGIVGVASAAVAATSGVIMWRTFFAPVGLGPGTFLDFLMAGSYIVRIVSNLVMAGLVVAIGAGFKRSVV